MAYLVLTMHSNAHTCERICLCDWCVWANCVGSSDEQSEDWV